MLALLEATPETPSCVVAMQGNRIQRLSLMECVNKVDYSTCDGMVSVCLSVCLSVCQVCLSFRQQK